MTPARTRADLTERRIAHFVARIDKSSGPDDCWMWRGYIGPGGYGRLGGIPAYRIAYLLWVGEIPEGMHVDHMCFVPGCVNPEHLQVLTPTENCRRKQRLARPTCPNGHLWTPENTYRPPRRSARMCRACIREQGRARAALPRARAAQAAYSRRPEVLARKREWMRAYHARKRALIVMATPQ